MTPYCLLSGMQHWDNMSIKHSCTGLEIKIFSREPNCIFKSHLQMLCIETSTFLGSLQKSEGAAGEFKGALGSRHPLISSPDVSWEAHKQLACNCQLVVRQQSNLKEGFLARSINPSFNRIPYTCIMLSFYVITNPENCTVVLFMGGVLNVDIMWSVYCY